MDEFIDNPDLVGTEEYTEEEKLEMLRDRLDTPLILPGMIRMDGESNTIYLAGSEIRMDGGCGCVECSESPYTGDPVEVYANQVINEETPVWGIEYGPDEEPTDEVIILADTSDEALALFSEHYPGEQSRLRLMDEGAVEELFG